MGLLLDTHTLLWWLLADKRLSDAALAALSSSTSTIIISSVCGSESRSLRSLRCFNSSSTCSVTPPIATARTQEVASSRDDVATPNDTFPVPMVNAETVEQVAKSSAVVVAVAAVAAALVAEVLAGVTWYRRRTVGTRRMTVSIVGSVSIGVAERQAATRVR